MIRLVNSNEDIFFWGKSFDKLIFDTEDDDVRYTVYDIKNCESV